MFVNIKFTYIPKAFIHDMYKYIIYCKVPCFLSLCVHFAILYLTRLSSFLFPFSNSTHYSTNNYRDFITASADINPCFIGVIVEHSL